MPSERWHRLEALYHAALERDGLDRDRFLEAKCAGDPEMRHELESLLDHGAATHAFFDSPATELSAGPLDEPPSLVGSRLGSYEIMSLLGEGGMGRVYRAHDSRLGRDVAVKVLHERFSARFEREARAVAALNHSNICTLYDIGPNYLVMELVDGESIAARLRRGPLPRELVLRFGMQIADALGVAHTKGIVHRDLKPENILISGDHVKLVDFGLAQMESVLSTSTPGSSAPAITKQGTVLGTLAYMSPEQVRGEVTDAKSDLFSLGVVLYEAASGTRAFARNSSAETIAAILKEDPPPLAGDPELDAIVRRCLVKDAGRRPHDAHEIAAALGAVRRSSSGVSAGTIVDPRTEETAAASDDARKPPRTPRRVFPWRIAVGALGLAALAVLGYSVLDRSRPTPAVPIRSLLVLPLDNISADPGQAYLADGLTEALTTALAKIESLRVVSRTTATQLKRQGEPLAKIGHDLEIDAVVEGSVARAGNQVRVTVQLVRVSPETHLWAESYERDISDALGFESDLTQAVASAIQVTLSPGDRARLGRRRTARPDAFETYLRARYYESGAAGLATEQAIATYKKAIELDPTFTPSRAGLARAYIFGVGMRPKLALATARETALEALRLDPDAPEALLASAITRLYYEHDFAGAAQEFQRAIAADPGNPDAHFYYSQCLAARGRFDDAVAAARRAQRLDPLSPLITHYIGRIYYFARQYDQAIKSFDEALDIDPNYAFTHVFFASTYERMHEYARALEHREAYMNLIGMPPDQVAGFRNTARALGYRAALRRYATWSIAAVNRRGYLTSSELGYVFTETGEADKAVYWLQRAVDDHVRDLIYLKVEPAFDELRGDPRFAALVGHALPE